jgi:hypothetical protein
VPSAASHELDRLSTSRVSPELSVKSLTMRNSTLQPSHTDPVTSSTMRPEAPDSPARASDEASSRS